MGVAVGTNDILSLARSRVPGDRDRLLLAVVELANGNNGAEAMAAAPVQGLLNSIFMSLVVEAERDIRLALADSQCGIRLRPRRLRYPIGRRSGCMGNRAPG